MRRIWMQLPDYVTVEEVRRVCEELHIRDWTTLAEPKVLAEEASAIWAAMDVEGMILPLEDFSQGLEVELEHGIRFEEANVTNNHPILTGRIVLAHLKESLDYYKRLEVAEIEGDLLKAVVAGNAAKVAALYRKLIAARRLLSEEESQKLAS
jgi:hypothetical protein